MSKKEKKSKNQKKEQEMELEFEDEDAKSPLDSRVKKNIIAVLLIMVALVILLSLVDLAGVVGGYIDKGLGYSFGWGKFLLPLVMVVLGIFYFKKMEPIRYTLASVGAVLFYAMFLGLVQIFVSPDQMIQAASTGSGGGYVGLAVAYPLAKYLGRIAGVIILFGFSLIGLMLIFNAPIYHLFLQVKRKLAIKKSQQEEDEEEKDKTEFVEDMSPTAEGKIVAGKSEYEGEEDDTNIKSIEFVEGPDEGLIDAKPYDEDEKDDFGQERKSSKRNIYSGMQWRLPGFDLLEKNKVRPHQANLEKNVEIITRTFENFNIKVEPSEFHVGPTVTQYTFKPAVDVRLNKILALQDNLSLALAKHPLRIEAPIPGKSLVGIEVPNDEKSFVRMRTMLESDIFSHRPSDLCLILGEDVNGFPVLANIEKMPHLMIAGSTGTGKSVCINVLLTTLLYQNSPENLRLILVDPKRVELSLYNDIPHLLTPVIVDTHKVVNALKWAVGEMERRYRLLQEVGSRDIGSYNDKAIEGKKRKVVDDETGEEKQESLERMPYIIIVIDELADLMASHARDVEGLIVRLAQMARAVGIHLVVSTQRPSVEVLTGLIKANINARVAFQVATQIDSRTILDMGGAEKLLGNGDLLYLSTDSSKPRRIQGIFISEQEVRRVVRFIKRQAKESNFQESEDLSESLDEQLNSTMGTFSGPDTEGTNDDELYQQAKEIVLNAGKASTSMLQRRLKIGYSRAARIVDMLEENGVVGKAEGSKAREVLVAGSKTAIEYEEDENDQAKREKWQ